jgi:hypothetical protein
MIARGVGRGTGAVAAMAILAVAACVALGGFGSLATPLAAASDEKIPMVAVHGTVTDASGAPVAFQTVRLLKTRRIRNAPGGKAREQEVEEARTRTNDVGAYRFEVQVDYTFPYWFVRFYDPKDFDSVKFLLPQDTDVSRAVREGVGVDASAVFRFHPEWERVKKEVDEVGAASHRGQILRSLGLPARRTPGEEGKEVWEYPALGIAYVLQEDAVVEVRRGEPVPPSEDKAEPVKQGRP